MAPFPRVLTASGEKKNDSLGCPGLATGFVVCKTFGVIQHWRLRDRDENVLLIMAGEAGWRQKISPGDSTGGCWRGGTDTSSVSGAWAQGH